MVAPAIHVERGCIPGVALVQLESEMNGGGMISHLQHRESQTANSTDYQEHCYFVSYVVDLDLKMEFAFGFIPGLSANTEHRSLEPTVSGQLAASK